MKKQLFISLGVITLLGFYSCQKNAKDVSPVIKADFSTHNLAKQNGSGFFDPHHLVSPGAHGKLDTLGQGFSFTEGPAVNSEGDIYFTDQPNDKIYKWDANHGPITPFLSNTGRSNGMAFDEDGYLIACADMHGEVWKIARDGSHKVIAKNYNNKLLNGPNDVWINPVTGGLYITDPIFPRSYWDANDPRQQPWEPTHS
ncbi:MAG: SMP-30/gluconolactonase/LRE family protein, partial [Mucilaginibacter sp.]